jgi:hypothetical protein
MERATSRVDAGSAGDAERCGAQERVVRRLEEFDTMWLALYKSFTVGRQS